MKALLIFLKLITLLLTVSSNIATAQLDLSKKSYSKVKKLERKNELLYQHTKTIERTLLSKDWDTFITFCISDNYEAQQENGIGQLQYIYELLNATPLNPFEIGLNYQQQLNYVLNNLKSFTVKKYTLAQKGMLGTTYYFKGEMVLMNGAVLLFEYELMELNKSFKLIKTVV